jgi:vanillate/3-O-methylgallate O-demethylase
VVGFRCLAATATAAVNALVGVVDPDIEIGTEVALVWGEEGNGTRKTTVERHRQIEIRAIVSPAPYSKVAREEYAEGWRTATAEA